MEGGRNQALSFLNFRITCLILVLRLLPLRLQTNATS
jgi:hypothetical protein